jgi:hypothetical protein
MKATQLGWLLVGLMVLLSLARWSQSACPQAGQQCQIGCDCFTCFESAKDTCFYNYIDGTCCRLIASCTADGQKLPDNAFTNRIFRQLPVVNSVLHN